MKRFEIHKFPKTCAFGVSFDWNSWWKSKEDSTRIQYLWLSCQILQWQLSYKWTGTVFGIRKICPECHKTFTGKSLFCSNDCYASYEVKELEK